MKRVVVSAQYVRALEALLYALVIVTGGLLADFAVNAVTGGTLPGPLERYRYFAWPTIVVVFLLSLAAAVRERLRGRDHGAPAAGSAAPAEQASGPFNLPPPSIEFTGRRRELAELRALVVPQEPLRRAAPIVATIYGPPGSGKSTLAVRFAHDMRQRYPDAQLYVHLQAFGSEPLSAPIEALSRLLRALGVRSRDLPADLDGLTNLYRDRLRGKRAIIVLDHAEDESQVQALLPGVPTCLVLITSLQPLDDLPGSERLRLGGMEPDEALDLLARVAGAHVKSPENVEAIRRVAALCGHLPLALSIVSVLLRRQRRRSVTELELELMGKRNILAKLHVGHLDVRAGFDVSYDHLEPRERMLFRRLGLLPEATFGADMAAALLDCPLDEAEQLLEGLVDEQVLESVGDGRFVLQNLLGLYAGERLSEEPEHERRAALARALRRHVAETMRHAALLDPAVSELAGGPPEPAARSLDEQLGALDWFERERVNLLEVVRQAAEIQAHDVVWSLAAGLVPFFDLRGHRADWREVQAAAIRSVGAGGQLHARAWTELGAGHLYWLEGDHRAATSHLEEALETAMAGRWPRLEARACFLMARVAHEAGDLDEALARYGRAANIYQRECLVQPLATVMLSVATVLHQLGQLGPADVAHLGESALATLAELPDELWVVRTVGRVTDYLGQVAEGLGDLEQAGTRFIAGGDAYREIGFRYGHGRARRQLGRVRLKQGSFERAADCLEESVGLFRSIGDRHAEGVSLLLAGEVAQSAGRLDQARARWREAEAAFAEIGAPEAA
ncbi:MAG TPA: NB-ARC domain-containing protein, partial [Candidatus Dormibacteraeota bacterium]|nr:NB-ARC domain-containing protein [Candidatus Dormibacteraeota bacterium]